MAWSGPLICVPEIALAFHMEQGTEVFLSAWGRAADNTIFKTKKTALPPKKKAPQNTTCVVENPKEKDTNNSHGTSY